MPAANEFAIAIGATVGQDQPGPGAGWIESPGVVDRYTFSAQAGQAVFFEEFPPSMPYLWWDLRDDQGTLVFHDHFQGSDVGVFTLTRGGIYTIEVSGWGQAEQTGTYGFKLWSETPLIQRPPSSLTVYVGRDATFSVLAESRFPLTYQWQFDGADLPGATQPVLTLSRVRADQAGSYTVRVSNAVGSVESGPALLTVDSNVPDLAVLGVNGPATGRPGEPVELTWPITNTGIAVAVGPWTETILLSTDNVPGNDQVIAVFPAGDALPAGQGLVRTQQVTLPRLGVAGTLWFVVRVDSENQVPEADESNNVAIGPEPIAITPTLTLQLARTSVAEGSTLQASLSRNGNLTSPLAVTLTASDTSEVNVASEAMIPSGLETVSFTLAALPDGLVDGDQSVVIEATAAGYAGAQANLVVQDVDVPLLALTLMQTNLVEGNLLHATLSLAPATSRDLTVTLESSAPDQLTVPSSAVIPAGETSVAFDLVAIDDAWLEATMCYSVNVFGPGLDSVAATVCVIDNDVPALTLRLDRAVVSEADGPLAATATLTRDFAGAIPIQFELESSDRSEILVPAAAAIPAGASSSTFPVSAVDDTLVDGAQTVELRAFLLETASGKRLGPPLVVPIEVTDNEAPSLTLILDRDWVPEGLAPAATGTVSRNPVTETALEVQLASDRPGEAAVPATVVIPAGQASATFEVASLDDQVTDGNQTVVITAQAPGFAPAQASLIVSDMNLPDLLISRLIAPDEGLTGASFTVTYRESNQGRTAAAGSWSQRLFLSSDPYPGDDLYLGEAAFSGTVEPGLYLERTLQYRLPNAPGEYWLVGVADAADAILEAVEANNTTVSSHSFRVTAAYSATVTTDVEVAPANTPVPLSGRAVRAVSGEPAAFELVNVQIKVRDTRRVLTALTDAQGAFATTFRPLPGEAGRYEIGAAHPGVVEVPTQDSFIIVGLRFDPPEVAIELAGAESRTGRVALVNLTEITLTQLSAIPATLPAGLDMDWTLPAHLPPDGTAEAAYRITSTADAPLDAPLWVDVRSAEGASNRLPVRVVVKPLVPRLAAVPGTLVASMVRGDQTLVTFLVQNDGGAATGPLQVLLPDAPWLQLATPSPLPPLEPGSNQPVTLQLVPPASMDLTEYPGNLVLTDGAARVNVPFRFRAVSDATGALRIVVEDEYTYYAEGAPRVAGAEIVVRDALSKEEVAKTTADASGWAEFTSLREGYYEVEAKAPDHNANRQTILISPGETFELRLFLPRQTVQYVWTVVPTTIEDHTRITIEAVFETEVPVPVITIEPPLIDLAEVAGDFAQIDLKITNHGLIAAEAMRFDFDTHPRWEIKPLVEDLGTLPARSSLTVPVRIRRLSGTAQAISTASADLVGRPGVGLAAPDPLDAGCSMGARLLWELLCGPSRNLYNRPIPIANVGGGCPYGGVVLRAAGGGGGGAFLGSGTVVATNFNCHPCAEKAFKAILQCAFKFIPLPDWIKCVRDQNKCIRSAWQGGFPPGLGTLYQCAKAQLTCVKAAGRSVPGLSYLKYLECAYSLLTVCQTNALAAFDGRLVGLHGAPPAAAWQLPDVPATIPELESVRVYLERAKRVMEAEAYLLGDVAWLEFTDPEAWSDWLEAFDLAVEGATEADWMVSETERAALLARPSASLITPERANAFIDRWNRSLTYWQAGIFRLDDVPPGQNTDFIAFDEWVAVAEQADAAADLAVADGFEDPFVGLQTMIDRAQRQFTEPNQGICATVRLSIDQDAVLTRDAFTASLELINRSDEDMTQLRVDLAVQDDAGAQATDRFVIRPPTLEGLDNVDGSGRVRASTSGRAAWTILPTSDAAPDRPRVYFVVGALAYSQEGTEVRVPLAPTPITVHPSPSLFLQYFHQRDVLADDPFTDAIEPSVPYSLAVMVRNQGAGEARNFRITSAQPKIVDNEKGLLINFEILATEVAGRGLTPSLTAEFGAIPPGGLAIGRWLFRSSLQGLFIDYEARFEHVDGLGEPRLSLIEGVEIHELIRIVHARGAIDDGLPDMLVNDFPDDLDLPDTLYLSSGAIHPVSVIRQVAVDGQPDDDNLSIEISATVPAGWVYLRLPDPAQGQYTLTRIARPDGTEIALGDNAWTTDRTFVGGGHRPVYEHTLHLLDYASPGAYTLTYAPPPDFDLTPPTSVVAALPADSYSMIAVAWSGADNPGGSGLDYYDLFVAVNDGPLERWLARTRLTGALYSGAFGNRYAFHSVATDVAGNTEDAPAAPDAMTTVTLQNTAPTLSVPGEIAVSEGETVAAAASATDPDLPPDILTFRLVGPAPPGVTIDATTGALRWVTSEADGPGRYELTVQVIDNGTPPLSATQPLVIQVGEVNEPPTLAPLANATIDEGRILQFTAQARDPDQPANRLVFRLDPGAPPGAAIEPATGLFTWRPGPAQGPSTNRMTVTVTDDGAPPLSDSQSFTVVVNDTLSDFTVSLGRTNLLAGEAGSVPVRIDTRADVRQLTFDLRIDGDRLHDLRLTPRPDAVAGSSFLSVGPGQWRCQLDAAEGRPFSGLVTLGDLAFATASDAPSTAVALGVSALEAVRSSGQIIRHGWGQDGRVLVIGEQPILEVSPEPDLPLALYGRPGRTYEIRSTTDLAGGAPWRPTGRVLLEGRFMLIDRPLPEEANAFHRAVELPAASLVLEIQRTAEGPLALRLFAPAGAEVILESSAGWTPEAVWSEEGRYVLESGVRQFPIDTGAASRFYRARIE
ncbi:MAG TPA: CARDB domain-containing protein [Verrucomicrobiota bacterium]|nr:CARDB domain-containing protein [Verrucomicrobiota bacterium]